MAQQKDSESGSEPAAVRFLAGIILVMLDWRLPMPIEASFRYLGGMTTPLAMLFIGIAISKASWARSNLTES